MGKTKQLLIKVLILKRIFLLIVIFLTTFSCQKKGCLDPNAVNLDTAAEIADNSLCLYSDFKKADMLSNICDNYILPAYTNFNDQTLLFQDLAVSFTENPTIGNLEILRNQFREALLAWQAVSFIDFGPANVILLKTQVNLYPTDTALIKENIALGNYNLESALNNDAKGFQAFDYLLHLPDLNDQEIAYYFTTNDQVKVYLQDLANNLVMNSQYVVNEWQSYKTNFKNNSETNAQGSSTSNLVNGLCAYFETYIRKGKIGLPLGVFNGFSQQEMPELVECYYRQESLPFAIAAMQGMKKYINGTSFVASENRLGLDDYMNYVGATQGASPLSDVITNQIDAIIVSLEELNDPLSNEIFSNKSAVSKCYEEMQQLVPYLKVDMTSALGVLITYQDNDGD